MQPTDERWLPVPGWEGLYEVSDLGRVRGLDRIMRRGKHCVAIRGRVLTPRRSAYPQVQLRRDGQMTPCYVHHLVARAFLGPRPDGMQVCHNDGQPANVRLTNLRYDTPSGNARDKRRHGTDHNARKTHCPKGHEYSPENTRHALTPEGGTKRVCRSCERAAWDRFERERAS